MLVILLLAVNRRVAVAKFYTDFFKSTDNAKMIGYCFHGLVQTKWVGVFNWNTDKVFVALECSLSENFFIEKIDSERGVTAVKEPLIRLEYSGHIFLTNNIVAAQNILDKAADCFENLFQLKCCHFEFCPAKKVWSINCPASIWVKITTSDWYPGYPPSPKAILIILAKLVNVVE